MENVDLIILSIIVVISFITFFVSTFRDFEKTKKNGLSNLEKRHPYEIILLF
jgi:hypothetical protein